MILVVVSEYVFGLLSSSAAKKCRRETFSMIFLWVVAIPWMVTVSSPKGGGDRAAARRL
jgi:hypothetical protein